MSARFCVKPQRISQGAPPALRSFNESNGPDGQRQQVQFESEPGVEIGGKLYIRRPEGRRPAVLLVADKASDYWIPSTDALAERIAKTARVVLELEPRDSPGEGERSPGV